MDFIELHRHFGEGLAHDGDPVFININIISFVDGDGGGAYVAMSGVKWGIAVKEKPEEVINKIKEVSCKK